ncbi:MAG: 8-oxo-dGTP diphosphatase MutT [Steroidobacter sp.]
MSEPRCIHVVAGAVCDGDQVLIAQRPPGKHMAGGWEFPGGKLHADESALDGLKRELKEELNIEVHAAEWLCECTHDYPDRRVRLELWLIINFDGQLHSNEGQPLQWVNVSRLHEIGMLPADEPLIAALQKRISAV